MTTQTSRSGDFTGRHMIAVMVAFFGVVIAVNMALAFFARSSWTGLVVENAYVASQEFNGHLAQSRAQAALGWTGTLAIDGQGISYRLADRSGKPVELKGVTVMLRRPSYAGEDVTLALARTAEGAFALAERVRDGLWIVEIEAKTAQAAPYRDVRRAVVREGALQ